MCRDSKSSCVAVRNHQRRNECTDISEVDRPASEIASCTCLWNVRLVGGALQKPFETLPGHLGQRDRPVPCGCPGVPHDHHRERLQLACRLQREQVFQAKTGSREDKEGVLRGAVQLLDYGFQFDVVEAASL